MSIYTQQSFSTYIQTNRGNVFGISVIYLNLSLYLNDLNTIKGNCSSVLLTNIFITLEDENVGSQVCTSLILSLHTSVQTKDPGQYKQPVSLKKLKRLVEI